MDTSAALALLASTSPVDLVRIFSTGLGAHIAVRQIEALQAIFRANPCHLHLFGIGPYAEETPRDLVNRIVRVLVRTCKHLPKVELYTDEEGPLDNLVVQLPRMDIILLSGLGKRPRIWADAWRTLRPLIDQAAGVIIYDLGGEDAGPGPLMHRLQESGKYRIDMLECGHTAQRALVRKR